LPYCDILNYCLMPTHFHLLIHATKTTVETKKVGLIEKNILSEGIRNLLQTYAKAINKQNDTTGSLFQQNTKAKCISEGSKLYGEVCFHYNHQNPMRAGLVKRMEDWNYSSFKDYSGLRNGTLCNRALAIQLLDINPETFYQDSYSTIDEEILKKIF
jgi:putative transposase